MTTPPQNPSTCPPWCTADHNDHDHLRIHQSQSTAIKAFQAELGGYRPAANVSLTRTDERERRGKTLITTTILATGATLHLSPNDANTLADILDALEADCPSPTDRLAIALSEAADLANEEEPTP